MSLSEPVRWLRANMVHKLPPATTVGEQLIALEHEHDPFPPLPVDPDEASRYCMRNLNAVEGWAGFNAEGALVAWRRYYGGMVNPLRLDPEIQIHVVTPPHPSTT